MTITKTTLVAQEAEWSGPVPDDWPKTRKARFEMLHGGAFVSMWPGTTLSIVAKDLRDVGYHVTKSRENGTVIYRAAEKRPRGRPPGARNKPEPKPEPLRPPELGTNLVVFALVEHEGEIAIGLAERDGRQWMATLAAEPLL